MSNPNTPREALSNAPIGTQWFTGGYAIRKVSATEFVPIQGGKFLPRVNLTQAVNLYNSNKLTNANRPEWYVKPTVSTTPPPPSTKSRTATAPARSSAPQDNKESNTQEETFDNEIIEDAPEQPDTENSQSGEILVQADRPTNDWRVKLSLAPGSRYLYNDPTDSGILKPLQETNGVIFPYMPQISVTYSANYNATDLVHSNYKVYQYASSSVDTISIVGDFTAQDTREAQYLLAVIHFFRSATKMFFGKDEDPRAGTPPPLCFIRGLGEYQFSRHPLVITNFSYVLPNDVDYIPTIGYNTRRATQLNGEPVVWKSSRIPNGRLPGEVAPGGVTPGPDFSELQLNNRQQLPTYVPSKITLNITCLPVVSRASLADDYSTADYARGNIYSRSIGGKAFW